MFDGHQLFLFFTASLVLLLIPGPAVIYIVSRSIEGGPKYGIISTAGIAFGGLVHVLAAVAGLSAVIATSATAFAIVKYLGAAYLIYLGISKIFEKRQVEEKGAQKKSVTSEKVFCQAVIVEVLNPKVALFFLSFLPQIVNPEKGNVSLQITILGFSFIALAFTTDSTYALMAGKLGSHLKHKLGRQNMGKYFSGAGYIGLGIFAAASKK